MGYWLKLYTDILDDPKYFELSDNGKLAMYEIYLVAKKVENGETTGKLPPIKEIAFYTRKSIEWWEPVIKELISLNIISEDGQVIKNFIKRQEAIPDYERSKQYRARCNASVMNGDSETSRELTFRDGEKNKNKNKNKNTEVEKEVDVDVEKNHDNNNLPLRGALISCFTEFTKIEMSEDRTKWQDAEIKMIKAGVTIDDLAMAIVEMQQKHKYKITSLSSVVTPALICREKRIGKQIREAIQ